MIALRRWLIPLGILLVLAGTLPSASARAAAPTVPLLLVHGYGGSAGGSWREAIPFFEQAGYQQGRTLFAVELPTYINEGPLDLLDDIGTVRAEMERIRRETGAAQVDLIGHSRGGLIVRALAAGESAALVRRAVSMAAPHDGVLSAGAIAAIIREAGLPPLAQALLPIPAYLEQGSPVLRTIEQREARFTDQRASALAIGVTWQDGAPAVLRGNDGIVSLASQLAWPGAERVTIRLGPPADQLVPPVDPLQIARQSPHLEALGSSLTLQAALAFLQAPAAPPGRACDPGCRDFADLAGHWSETTLHPWLLQGLPYDLTDGGERRFGPDQRMARAEFTYALVRLKRIPERLQPTPFADLVGHWSLGYAEAARSAGLVKGVAADQFAPDRLLTRAEAATLVVRALGLGVMTGPSGFPDTTGHWAEGWIGAAASRGLVVGDERGFRPDDPVTRAEGAVILVRALGD